MPRGHSQRLRRARRSDIAALVTLEAQFPTDQLSRASLRHLLTRAHADVLIIEVAGTLIGNVVVLYRKNSLVARIYSLVIDPAFRGRGFGERLIAAAEAAARKRGCRGMSLEVRPDNRVARKLYLRRSYVCGARIEDFYEDGTSALRFTKSLGRRKSS